MNKSNIANGQMFIHFTPSCMDKPKVWVKVTNKIFGNKLGEVIKELNAYLYDDKVA